MQRDHRPALRFKEAPSFYAELRQREAVGARCHEFVALPAVYSDDALGATWGEIDFEERLWTMPATQMKAKAEYVVPLSEAAVDLLSRIAPAKMVSDTQIFAADTAARSDMAMDMLLQRRGHRQVTTHGFRSTFRDWAGDKTESALGIVEQALSHTSQSKAERAYRRVLAIERRGEPINGWTSYLDNQSLMVR